MVAQLASPPADTPPPVPETAPAVPPAGRTRRSFWLYLLLAPAVIVAGFGLGVTVVAAWSASQARDRGELEPPDLDPIAESVVVPVSGESTAGFLGEAPTEAAAQDAIALDHHEPTNGEEEAATDPPPRESPTPVADVREDPTPGRPTHSAPEEAPGTISLYVTQWSHIYVDGALVASEANFLRKHAVGGGRHTVKVTCGSETCPCAGLKKTYRVKVDGDDVKLPHLDFQELSGGCP